NGIVSYWKLDEASGTVIDELGINNGTNNGSTTSAIGKINTAYDFNVNTDHINTTNTDLNDLENHTVSMWLKRNGNGISYATLFSNGVINTGISILQEAQTQNVFYRLTDSAANTDLASTGSELTSEYNHFVFSFNGTDMMIYVNGTLVKSQSAVLTLDTAAGDYAFIGGIDGIGSFVLYSESLLLIFNIIGIWPGYSDAAI
ncbi:hypothetical protein LCGC14_2566820, partial [marine sediment metagenome]